MRKQAAILANMNTYTDAETAAALNGAQYIREWSLDRVLYAPEPDREAAAEALRARVAETLLGNDYVIVPRYVLAELRKQMGELPV